MTRKATPGTVYTALLRFHGAVEPIPMNGLNPRFNSRYATLDDIIKGIQKPLTDAGLVIVHRLEGQSTMTTEIVHAATGESISSTYELRLDKESSQGWGSAITYSKRFAISCLLNLCLDADDDGNSVSPGVPSHQQAQRGPAQPEQRRQAPQQNYGDEGDDHPWLNLGRDLDDSKKAVAQGSMMMETDRGPVTRFIESATGSERIFKVNNKTKGELQEILQPARTENNRSFDEQRRRHDGPHPF